MVSQKAVVPHLVHRLESIKTAISLEDEETISLHREKIRNMDYDVEGLPAIMDSLDNFDYVQALSLITDFLEKQSSDFVAEDIEVAALRMEILGLEQRLMKLHIDREEFLYIVNNFNRQYSVRLDSTILKILKLQIMITCVKEAEYLEEGDNNAEYKEKRRNAQATYKHFQKLSDASRMQDLANVVGDVLVSLKSDNDFSLSSQHMKDKKEMRLKVADLRQQIDDIESEIERIESDTTWQLLTQIGDNQESYFVERETALNEEMTRLRQQFLEMIWWETENRVQEKKLLSV